ncbi:MAG: aryl-sulfate sulfotransferase [Myxococcota bacterium]
MRSLVWWSLVACGGGTDEMDVTGDPSDPSAPPVDTGTSVVTKGPKPCESEAGLVVESAMVEQPWSEHEARFTVSLSSSAALAVACALDGDDTEVHLVEGVEAQLDHTLRLAGLLASSTYTCTVAPVCPTTTEVPTVLTLQTGDESNSDLPQMNLEVHQASAGRDYVLTNHQRNDGWNGQRRLVVDRDAQVRWRAAANAGGGVGGSAVNWSPTSQAFTIGGGWPPNHNGRPQQIELFGSDVRYDSAVALGDLNATWFHHDARELSDGQFLTLEEPVIQRPGGGTFRGFGVRIVDPETDEVTFDWSSQRPFDEGNLPGGGGDAYHANWVDIVDVDGQDVMYVSLCTQGWTVAVDVPSGDWRWTFGRNGDFDLVDTDGNALPDSEYPQCQHGLQRRDDRLLVYDNGNQRGFSRAVEYRLDESTMTATKLWDWTEPQWYETSLGGVDYTSGERVLIAMGHIEAATPTPGDRTSFVEVDPTTGEKLWEVQYDSVHDMAFRAEAISPCAIFANAKYCPVVAERLETLAPVLDPS